MTEEGRSEAGEIAVLRLFPQEHQKIRLLLVRDGDFRDLCDELAEAESALQATEALPLPVRAERRAEWTASIDRLTAMIARTLRATNAVRPGWLSRLKIIS